MRWREKVNFLSLLVNVFLDKVLRSAVVRQPVIKKVKFGFITESQTNRRKRKNEKS